MASASMLFLRMSHLFTVHETPSDEAMDDQHLQEK